ncbi:MAG TPA: MdtA/MuxA family multidrug efflux RND transporter periplasmic adaptor subunit [Candidatus Angelobacter sp.]|jgi:multidrug efflux system membrane fusion protein|nr:MdtA/MuxA family multidrug efflux RND transporter periplasmic adaptor subunit [Candidatus Angelobacter sp.]
MNLLPHFKGYLCRLSLAALVCALLAGCSNSPNPQAASKGDASKKGQGRGGFNMTIPVAVAKAETRDLPVYLNGLGSVEAFNTVVVKSRIDGQLVEIHFREGQEVKQGDLLAVIDPRPYQVQLSQMEATLYKDQSALKDAELNFQRFQDLYKQGIIPQQQFDTQKSLVGQLEGAVRADQAQIDNVKLNLNYTHITAPVSGRVGLRQVDIGNMVHASDPNGLLVITQLQPIAVIFTLPADNISAVSKQMNQRQLQADAFSRDDQTKVASGKLLTIDNQIDPTTGTAKFKAVFENKDHALWPNQFVNVHLLLEVRKNNTVVPAAAIQRGPQGTYVFAVKPDNTADMRKVTVAFSEGNVTAVSSGLNPGDVVVTDGQDKLQPGTKVEIRGGESPRPGTQSGTQAGQGL